MTNAVLACSLPRSPEDEPFISSIIEYKREEVYSLIEHCHEHGYKYCAIYLSNAAADTFRAFENKLSGRITSLVERVMRSVNFRTKLSKWTGKNGALNVNKIRLAH